MPLIPMPDGSQLNLPDNPSPQQLDELEKLQRGPSTWDTVKLTGKDLVRGALKTGAALLEGAAGQQTTAFVAKQLGLPAYMQDPAPISSDIGNLIPGGGDKTFRQAAFEGIGGGAISGPRQIINYAAGLVGGLGGEAGERLGGTPGAIVGGVLGGVAGGAAAGMAARVRPQTGQVAREMLEGLTEQQLNQAQVFKNELAKRGQNIDLAQALKATSGYAGNVESIRNFLANRSQGNKVQATLREQPAMLGVEADTTVEGMRGRNLGQDQNADYVQQTASKVYDDAKKARSAEVRGLYEKAGTLDPKQRDKLIQLVRDDIAQPGMTEIVKARGEDFIRKMMGSGDGLEAKIAEARKLVDTAVTSPERIAARVQLAKLNAELDGRTAKPTAALDVDTAIGEFAKKYEAGNPLKVADPKATGQVKGLAGKLNKEFQDMSPEVKAAEQRYAYLTARDVAPLKKGPIGTLNQPSGFNPETAAQVSKFQGLMDTGTETMTDVKVSRIGTAANELAKADPNAFEGAFKGWFAKKIDEAKTPGVGDSPLPTVDAAKIWDSVFGNSQRWQGVQDATAAMAKIRGDRPEEVIRGLNNLRQLTAAVKSRPDQIGGISPTDLATMGGNSSLADAARVFSYLPAGKFAQRVEQATLNKTLSQLDTILTSPDGVKMLIKLGKVPIMSRKAQVILGTWGGMTGNSDGLTENNPAE